MDRGLLFKKNSQEVWPIDQRFRIREFGPTEKVLESGPTDQSLNLGQAIDRCDVGGQRRRRDGIAAFAVIVAQA